MDYFNDVFATFQGLKLGSCVAVYARSESSWKNILICVLKMNEDLTCLRSHESQSLMTEFFHPFLGELSL